MVLNALSLSDITELRKEAVEARDLASMLKDEAAVADLLSYASALEADISLWEDNLSPDPF